MVAACRSLAERLLYRLLAIRASVSADPFTQIFQQDTLLRIRRERDRSLSHRRPAAEPLPMIKFTLGRSALALNNQRSLKNNNRPSVGHFEQNLPLLAIFGLVGKAKTLARELSVVLPARHGVIPEKSTS